MQITKEVWQVGGDSLTDPEDAAIYMICFGEQAALIDAGTGTGHKRLIKNIEKCGVNASQIEYLFLTHCHFDHTGGAQKVRDECSCQIVAHELDAIYLEKGDTNVTAARWYGKALKPFPKSEIDFMQIGVSWRFSLKKQSRDQKYVSPLMHLAHLFIFMASACALGTPVHMNPLKSSLSVMYSKYLRTPIS